MTHIFSIGQIVPWFYLLSHFKQKISITQKHELSEIISNISGKMSTLCVVWMYPKTKIKTFFKLFFFRNY